MVPTSLGEHCGDELVVDRHQLLRCQREETLLRFGSRSSPIDSFSRLAATLKWCGRFGLGPSPAHPANVVPYDEDDESFPVARSYGHARQITQGPSSQTYNTDDDG